MRESHEFRIKAAGQFCNDLPRLRITLDGSVVHDGSVGDMDLQFEIPRTACVLVLEHYDKRFGENRRWDTKSVNSEIVQDRKIVLHELSLDGISTMNSLHRLQFNQKPVTGEPIIGDANFSGTFNFNGTVRLDMSPSPMNWLINLLHKQELKDISYFSDYSRLFHYENERRLIAEIGTILDDLRI